FLAKHKHFHTLHYSILHANFDTIPDTNKHFYSIDHAFHHTVINPIQYSNPKCHTFWWRIKHMSDITPFLKSLISVAGVSGFEAPVGKLVKEKWSPLVDEISESRLGSIHGRKSATLKTNSRQAPSVLIATHMDAIGLMVSRIVDEFLYITNIGGIDSRVLPGTPVTVHAS